MDRSFMLSELEVENAIDRLQNVPYHSVAMCSEEIKKNISALEVSLQDCELSDALIANHQRLIDHLRKSLRKAMLSIRNKQIENEKTTRIRLFDGMSKRSQSTSTSSREQESIQAKSKEFSNALNRTRKMLSNEIKKSADALRTLEASANQVEETKTEYDKYGSELGTGNNLITKLTRREFTDRILAVLGGIFFLLTVIYIVKRRMGNLFELLDIFF